MRLSAHSYSAVPQRRYDIDALRVLAFGLLILYHVGMFYVAGWDWHVKSQYLSEPLQTVMRVVNPWRMPLIFLISGVASHFLLRKDSATAFAWSRSKRLLIPLLFGMAVVVPPQAYLQALSNNAFDGNYLSFLWRYFTFQPWPAGAFDGADIGVTWNHLWYLPYLLTYSIILALLQPLLQTAVAQSVIEGFHRMRNWQPIVLPALPFLIYEWALNDRFPVTHAYFGDWDCHAVSFTAFMLGYMLGSRDTLWDELVRLRWVTLMVAVATYLWLATFRQHVGLELPTAVAGLAEFAIPVVNGWCGLLAVLGWGHYWLNRPLRWLPYATEAVYPWYILHQTFTIIAGVSLSRLALGPVVEPVLVITATVAGCYVTHEFVVRRCKWLRPLFGLKKAPIRGRIGAAVASAH